MKDIVKPNVSFLMLIGALYSFQSILGAITFQGMPAVLREAGVEPARIGLVYLLMLPWALKFLWAAALERWRNNRNNTTKAFFLLANATSIVLLGLLMFTSPGDHLIYILLILGVIAFLSSSVDISLDAYAIGASKKADKSWVNVMQIGGGYMGAILGGGIFLILIEKMSWTTALAIIALVLLALLVFVVSKPLIVIKDDGLPKPQLKNALLSMRLQMGLLIIVVAQMGLRLAQGMTMPFFIDQGITLSQLGYIATFGGSLISLAAVLLAGLWVTRKGAWSVLISLLFIQLLIYGCYYLASSQSSLSVGQASVLLLSNNACAAATFVGLYTLMMSWTSKAQAGVDFSLLQCMDTAVALFAGLLSGAFVQVMGYENYFIVCCLMSGMALLVLPYLGLRPMMKQEDA